MKKRKVIALTTYDWTGSSGVTHNMIVAACDDGTLWEKETNVHRNLPWEPLESIPQPKQPKVQPLQVHPANRI